MEKQAGQIGKGIMLAFRLNSDIAFYKIVTRFYSITPTATIRSCCDADLTIRQQTDYAANERRLIMRKLNTGDKAPHFQLKDQNGQRVGLSDFAGKKLFLYFYPKANTSG